MRLINTSFLLSIGDDEEIPETIQPQDHPQSSIGVEQKQQQQQKQQDLIDMPHNKDMAGSSSTDSHPSWWIQDFLHTTLGIARRAGIKNRTGTTSPEAHSKSLHDPDPASTSGQIQLWQVKWFFFFRVLLNTKKIIVINFSFYWNCWRIRKLMLPGLLG